MAILIVVSTYATRSHSYRYNAFPYTAYTAFQAKTPHTVHCIFCPTSTLQNTVCTIYHVYLGRIRYTVYCLCARACPSYQHAGVRYDIRFNILWYKYMVGYTVCTNEKIVPYKHTNMAVYTVNENHRTVYTI